LAVSERYTVRVIKDFLVFSAGHFITYDGDRCERLHGHNYRVAVELDAPLDANHYAFDFIALRDRTREITDELDHRMLVPATSQLLKCEVAAERVTIRFGKKEWVFPREDCAVLPIPNTTTELLARHIGQKLLAVLKDRHHFVPDVLRVEVEENFGQCATYEWWA
jgi:6-pyruvoyltetrahydropterin/6-carboxytetrahydropterin synthase